jgi:hypothetical protein
MFSNGKGYYMMGIIPFLFAVGGFMMEKYLKHRLAWLNYAIIALTAFVSLIALPFGLPIMSHESLKMYSQKTDHLIIYPFSRWEDGKIHNASQAYSDMVGWKELTSYVAKAYGMLSKEEQQKCTIYGERNYGYAGAINFYGKRYNLPDAITFLDSYVIWAPESIPKGPFIYINYDINGFNQLFEHITEIGKVDNPYFRENGLKVFLCETPKTDIQEVYKQEAMKEKKIYR